MTKAHIKYFNKIGTTDRRIKRAYKRMIQLSRDFHGTKNGLIDISFCKNYLKEKSNVS